MSSIKRLYKDSENKWFFGVCAGIADYLGIDVIIIRGATFFSLFFFFPIVVTAYIAMGLFLPVKPTERKQEDDTFVAQLPITLTELEIKFTDIEQRMRKVENYVTSDTFELQRKIWHLQDKA